MNKILLKDNVEVSVLRQNIPILSTIWDVQCFRDGRLLWREVVGNLVTNEGINHVLDVVFDSGTPITAWYVLIFNGSSPSISSTYAVPIFTESTAYDEATRPAYTQVVSTTQCTNNAAKAVFTIDSTVTIDGAALVGGGSGASTKGNVAGGGVLYCAADFASAKSCVDNDVLSVSITIVGSDV